MDTDPVLIDAAKSQQDIEAVRSLCWDYRDFLLSNSSVDREITETFYPVAKYQALMDALPALHARPAGIMLLARDATGTPLGCGMTHTLGPGTAEIKRVYVTDAARGRGVARDLCTALITQARSDGFARIVLDTSKSLIAAQSLYLKLGFRPRGPYQDIPQEVLSELMFYELDLRPDQP